ncbi:MAG: hypothetical protein IJP89_05730 [Synergistaceae bacterium]|nr:hypothetical protein [Synergistaceae bacterium]
MKAKIFLIALIISAIFSASSHAEITPAQVLADPRFAPFVASTKADGLKLLPGRYAVLVHTRSRTEPNGNPIMAPTELVIDIGQYDPTTKRFPASYIMYGEEPVKSYYTLDLEAPAPVLSRYVDDENSFPPKKNYAVAVQENGYVIWILGSVVDGSLAMLFPVKSALFPEGWYLGSWKCDDGTQFTFEGNKLYSNGYEIGTFTVQDSWITVTALNGDKDVMYAQRNIYNNTLVIAFNNGPNGMGRNAGVFNLVSEPKKPAPTPEAPKPAPKPESSAPKMPTYFPKMPDVKMPPQNLNIDGVWGAYVDGRQWITQYDGSNYYGWIDGQPTEMGIIRVDGNTLTGTNNAGVDFTAELELDASGKFLTLTFPNGNSIRYMRLK